MKFIVFYYLLFSNLIIIKEKFIFFYLLMKKKILLLTLLFIFFVSLITGLLILFFLDPYRDVVVSLITIGITFVLFGTSFFSLVLYFFKKVYYRGEIFMDHIFSSMRQAFLITSFFIGLGVFHFMDILHISTVFLYVIILFFLEMIFQNF